MTETSVSTDPSGCRIARETLFRVRLSSRQNPATGFDSAIYAHRDFSLEQRAVKN